tara:strand:- start:5204 stop:5842 length:639 start_codon:yes stop_codon:yes gene_type:complete
LDSLTNDFGSTESEKEIKDNNFNYLIKRNLDLFTYEISTGKTIPIKGNVVHFKPGNSISLLINTPYKTPKIFNRFKFNISSEISFMKMINDPTPFKNSFSATSFHIILKNKQKAFRLLYGLGFAQHFNSTVNVVVPSFKIKTEYEMNMLNSYLFLTNNGFLDINSKALDFFQKLHLFVGFEPQLTFGLPIKGITKDPIIFANLYFRLNLFDI